MQVKQLIEELQKLDQDSEVILQKDSEGNGYSPLSDIDGECIYVPDSAYSGSVYPISRTAEDNCMEDDEWEELKKQKPCVVFCPVN